MVKYPTKERVNKMTIQEALIMGTKKLNDYEKLDSRNLAKKALAFLMKKDITYLAIHLYDRIEENIEKQYKEVLQKIGEGTPIQYIMHEQSFMGINFFVDENVLIPQPDTEILVQEVITIANKQKLTKILDLCTGSGAIAVALAKNLINSNITATDISKKALEIAKKNSDIQHVNILFIESNLFQNIEESFDIIVSNPPYIKTSIIKTLDKEVQKEPTIALDGGEDGLAFYKNILKEAKKHLKANGYLAVEIGFDQKEEVMSLFKDEQYREIYCKKDFGNNDRVIVGKK